MSTESNSRVIHENLDTSFVNLWSLLRSLSQRGFIGRVHVELTDYAADVYLTGSNTPLVHEIDRAAGTETLESAALHRLVLRTRESSGSISVFEGADEAVIVRKTTPTEPLDQEDMSAPAVFSSVDEASEPVIDEPVSSTPAVEDRVIESPTKPDDDDSERTVTGSEILKASGELIGGVERALTGAGADFESLFSAARLELADDYTFLDPMSNKFAYANSVVALPDDSLPNSYVVGLSEALRRVVDKAATGDRARRLRERVALELVLLSRRRKELWARSGFSAQFDRIAGTKVI
ncbi:MAG: hypothetical protein AABM67_19415 [Acidobacteriota bacterium]